MSFNSARIFSRFVNKFEIFRFSNHCKEVRLDSSAAAKAAANWDIHIIFLIVSLSRSSGAIFFRCLLHKLKLRPIIIGIVMIKIDAKPI